VTISDIRTVEVGQRFGTRTTIVVTDDGESHEIQGRSVPFGYESHDSARAALVEWLAARSAPEADRMSDAWGRALELARVEAKQLLAEYEDSD